MKKMICKLVSFLLATVERGLGLENYDDAVEITYMVVLSW